MYGVTASERRPKLELRASRERDAMQVSGGAMPPTTPVDTCCDLVRIWNGLDRADIALAARFTGAADVEGVRFLIGFCEFREEASRD